MLNITYFFQIIQNVAIYALLRKYIWQEKLLRGNIKTFGTLPTTSLPLYIINIHIYKAILYMIYIWILCSYNYTQHLYKYKYAIKYIISFQSIKYKNLFVQYFLQATGTFTVQANFFMQRAVFDRIYLISSWSHSMNTAPYKIFWVI